ncbi:class I SAM-dependent methyltransferase [Streptomyces catenulae]|uniref:Class I SAM-dependent methyltransferase n=1 Tax=Streptomyces catenulae TaxID=66875 RepID=A0ABV2Z868_9ACTN|nr:class I SAM-dependent methyltransferase [Streptomyces catenulae]
MPGMPGRTETPAAPTAPAARRTPASRRTADAAPPVRTDPPPRALDTPRPLLPWLRVPRAPYRRALRRIGAGRVLDIGCGTGDTLAGCAPGSVGIAHDAHSADICRARGLTAYTADAFLTSAHARPGGFDTLLSAQVLQHLDDEQVEGLLRAYLPYVRPGGGVVLITPQEAGHRGAGRFTDFTLLRAYAESAGLSVRRTYSFPLPRPAGKVLGANAFVLAARVPTERLPG